MSNPELRTVLPLKEGWKFTRNDDPASREIMFDDAAWDSVRVPHDWAITGPFDRNIDMHYTKILADGETRERNHLGRTGGLPHVGIGWYRLNIDRPADWAGKHIELEFDGVMSHAEVFCNGRKVGGRPFGYSSFSIDLSDALETGNNVIAVRCDNPPLQSRWYPGAGIFRNVRLTVKDAVHVAHWGTWVSTPVVDEEKAEVVIRTVLCAPRAMPVRLESEIVGPDGEIVARLQTDIVLNEEHTVHQEAVIENPRLWSLDAPRLYSLRSRLFVDAVAVDATETCFGIRFLEFDAWKGFALNGRTVKLNGVCMHHDLGPLGAAVNRDALERQIDRLQEMGCNAIRTSHNPPTPELLDLCDEKGLLVIDEAFDEWRVAKVDNGYHTLFDAWAEEDLRTMIRRDRNHPCVIMWSIGNEILEQLQPDGYRTARFLHDICRNEDPTRPTTAGFNSGAAAIKNGLAEVVDVPGWNYDPDLYARYKAGHPDWPMYGSETASCVSTRDEYYFPPEEERDVQRDTLQVTSYDLSGPPWAYSPDVEFQEQDRCPWVMGEFVWTGWDYLGEPTPYKVEWPSRSAYFGIIDLCGIPKDRFYLYQSQWSRRPVLHLLPHWTWPGRDGEYTPVHCYTGYYEVELFVNGKSFGRRKKQPKSMTEGYRLVWNGVRYEPGEIRAVAYDRDGVKQDECVRKTAGTPAAIKLVQDWRGSARGEDAMVFVRAEVVDAQGVVCPHADHRISFSVEGPAEIAAVGNGDPTSLDPFNVDWRRAFHGKGMAYLRYTDRGALIVRAAADGLENAELVVAE